MEFIEDHPGGASLEEVGEVFGLTRQRVEQIEKAALAKLGREMMRAFPDWFGVSAREWMLEQEAQDILDRKARRNEGVAVCRLFRAMARLGQETP